MRTSITLIPKLVKDISRKESDVSIYIMNIDAKIIKLLGNWIQQYVKSIIPYEQVEFIAEWKVSLKLKVNNYKHHINRIKEILHDHFNTCRQSIWQDSTLIHDKTQETRNRRKQSDKGHLWKTSSHHHT